MGSALGLSRVRVHHVFVHPDGAGMAALAVYVRAGQLRGHIQHRYPLAQVADAHAHLEGGHTRGKLVLIPDEPRT